MPFIYYKTCQIHQYPLSKMVTKLINAKKMMLVPFLKGPKSYFKIKFKTL